MNEDKADNKQVHEVMYDKALEISRRNYPKDLEKDNARLVAANRKLRFKNGEMKKHIKNLEHKRLIEAKGYERNLGAAEIIIQHLSGHSRIENFFKRIFG